MTEEQKYVLDSLKQKYLKSTAIFPALLFDYMIKDPMASIAYDQLTTEQEFEVIKAFGEWGLNHV